MESPGQSSASLRSNPSWQDEDKFGSTFKKPLLVWDDFSPNWERKFNNGVESMRTIPHISLMRFSFIKVKFQDHRKPERIRQQTSSMTSLNRHVSSDLESVPLTNSHSVNSQTAVRHSVSADRKRVEGILAETNASSQEEAGQQLKTKFLLKAFRKTRTRMRRLFRKSEPKSDSPEERSHETSKRKKPELPAIARSFALSLHPNESVHLALQLLRLNNPLLDYNESQRKKRIKRLGQIMDKDEGPFFTDYRYERKVWRFLI